MKNESKKRGSVVTQILLIIIISFVLLGTISGVVGGVASFSAIYQESINTLTQQNMALAHRIDGWLASRMELAENSATLLRDPNVSREVALTYFTALVNAHGDVSDVYAGFQDGTGIFGMGWEPFEGWYAYERPWFLAAAANPGQVVLTVPWFDLSLHQLAFSNVRTINNYDAEAGVVSVDIPLQTMADFVDEANVGTDAFSFLVAPNGDILLHPDPDFQPDDDATFRNINVVDNGNLASMFSAVSDVGFYEGGGSIYMGSPLTTAGWYVVTSIPVSHIMGTIYFTIAMLVIAIVATLIVVIPITWVRIKSHISKPLAVVDRRMKSTGIDGIVEWSSAENAELDKYKGRNDEIGRIFSSYAALTDYIRDVCNELQKVAAGDLKSDIHIRSNGDTLSKTLQQMVSELNNMFGKMNLASSQVSAGSQQIAEGAQILAQGSAEQSATIQRLSLSTSEIADMTNANAQKATKAAELASTIKGNAEMGNKQMDEMVAAVGEISDASLSISKVIKVIDDIAFQTNILALNAAVEAARAGQHGKGFAVVAEEVRTLAAKSAEAAKDTGTLISNSMDKAEQGARIAKGTAESLTEIVSGINESTEIISEIAEASKAQTTGITEISTGIDQVATIVHQNSAAAEESAATSVELSGQSSTLEDLIAQFKLKDTGMAHSFHLPEVGSAMAAVRKSMESNQKNKTIDDNFGKY